MTDPVPTCDATNGGDDWSEATEADLIRTRPCDYCFPDTEDVDEIDEPLEHLVVGNGRWANCVHIHEDHGEPSYGDRDDQSDLASRLLQADPADLDLPTVDGGEV